MSGHNGRTPPFRGFSRGLPVGVPIVGQRPPEPPKGLYYYQAPALIQRSGLPLEADTFEFHIPQPLEGVRFLAVQKEIMARLAKESPNQPAPKVILLQPVFLGFVPQEKVDEALTAEQPTGEES